MASKTPKSAGNGINRKSQEAILRGLRKAGAAGRKKESELNPLLMPAKIKGPVSKVPPGKGYDILDMKSKKIITGIGENISELASINPLEEGGFGYDHPAVKTPRKGKKNARHFSEAEATENIGGYAAVLKDLISVMDKLAESRKQVFRDLSKNN